MRISGVMMLALGVVAYEEEAAMLQVKGDENAELALQEVARSQPFTGPNGVARRRRPVSPTKPTPTPPTPTPTPSPKVHKRGNKKVTKAYKKVRKAYKRGNKEAHKAYKKPPVCKPEQQDLGELGCRYKCASDLVVPVTAPQQKGLALDDTTLHWCPGNLPFHWPNTDEPVTSFRMFKAWASHWDAEGGEGKENAWQSLASFLEASNGKVLVGTQITCSEEKDDEDWENVKKMLRIFGSDRVMGLAVGNELELLWTKKDIFEKADPPIDLSMCLDRMWNQRYFLNKFHSRVQEMDALGAGFEQLPVTSVFGAFIMAEEPFHETCDINDRCARVNSFTENVTQHFRDRYAHTVNIYPYFDWGHYDNPGEEPLHCEGSLATRRCFHSDDPKDCSFTAMVEAFRGRLDLTGNADATLWVGETGWSAPMATTLSTNMNQCGEWSSKETFAEYYMNFLDWDMNINSAFRGPDHVFYFTMRDSQNFGKAESFGLMGDGDPLQWCTNTTCKIQRSNSPPPSRHKKAPKAYKKAPKVYKKAPKVYKKAPKAYKKAPKAYKKATKAPKAPKASRTRTYKKAPKASRTRTYKKVTKARRPRSTRR